MDTVDLRPLAAGCALPEDGDLLDAARPSAATLAFLARRRSLVVKNMTEPGPSALELDTMLRLAVRVPDHGKLAPWRFVVIEGAARDRLGGVLEDRFRERQPDASPSTLALERGRFARAPVVVTVVSAPVLNAKVPEWEQVLSAGAVCHQLLLVANAAGFAAQWLTEWYAFDHKVQAALGVVGGERVAGFVYIGSARVPAEERGRPDARALTTRL